ncbi:unnamed protein product, partial [Ranitomeya imitator]
MRSSADAHRRPAPTFAPGDLVWLSARNIRLRVESTKFAPRYLGPFKVLEQVNPVVYHLALPPRLGITDTFHVSLLKPVYMSRFSESSTGTSGLSTDDYEVNAILGYKVVRGKKFYLVDWRGYGPEDRSWEPAEHIRAPQLIAAFERSGSDLSIRLVNGNGQCNGRVEILYNGAWGTVCDDYWDINAAQVVCRQLNCGQALAFNGSAAFGQGQGVIVLDDVQCTGNEQHVWDCLHQPFTVHNCGHNEDAGVVCSGSGSDLSIRLVNGNGQCNGRVEILYNGAWGTVCDDYWDINAAQVVCRQLNCGQALAFNGSAAFGQGQGVIVLDDVQCTGNEQHVWDCLHQPFTVHNCGHNEDAGVVCSGKMLLVLSRGHQWLDTRNATLVAHILDMS